MSEWGVVSVLVTLIGLFATVGVPVINNTKKMTELIVSVDSLTNEIQEHKVKIEENANKLHSQELELAILKEKVAG